jgi:hypothetical protein
MRFLKAGLCGVGVAILVFLCLACLAALSMAVGLGAALLTEQFTSDFNEAPSYVFAVVTVLTGISLIFAAVAVAVELDSSDE